MTISLGFQFPSMRPFQRVVQLAFSIPLVTSIIREEKGMTLITVHKRARSNHAIRSRAHNSDYSNRDELYTLYSRVALETNDG